MLKIRLVRDQSGFNALAQPWNSLLARSEMDIIYMTHEWFRMYWELLEKNSEMLIAVLNRDGEPEAIVPLMRIKAFWRGVPHTCLTFIANFYSCRVGAITTLPGNVIGPVLDHLEHEHIGFDMLYANFIPEDSKTNLMLKETLAKRGMKYRLLDSWQSPYITLPSSWEEYLTSKNKHFRDSVKRTIKMFETGGEYTLRTYTRPEEFTEAWGKLLEVSRTTWKYKLGSAIANKGINQLFYRTFAKMAVENGWFKMLILEHKKRPIAFTYEFPYKDRLFFNKTGFDESYGRASPGMYILSRSLQDAIGQGKREFDLLGRNEEYKMRFTSSIRTHYKYVAFNNSRLGRLLSDYELRMVPMAKEIARRVRRRGAAPEPQPAATPAGAANFPKTGRDTVNEAYRDSPLHAFKRSFKYLLMTLTGHPTR
jgi:CelD/BcsL family acetyltransferase involved in cellulose biosynthesis